MKDLGVFSFIVAFVACSSSETTTTPGSSSGGASSGSSSCNCNVSVNGDSKNIACGSSACVGGESYECGAQAALSQSGNACASSSSSSSSGGSSSGGATATSVDCPNAVGAVDDQCDATKEYCILAKNGGSAATCAPFPAGCSSCSCASDDADAAWKKANNGTSNCGTSTLGTAVITCQSKNGAVTVTCK